MGNLTALPPRSVSWAFDLKKYRKNTQDGDAALICAMLNLYYGSAEFAAVVDAAMKAGQQ